MSQAQWTERELILRNNFGNRGLRDYWAENGGTYTPSFRSLVDRVLKELDTNPAVEPGASQS